MSEIVALSAVFVLAASGYAAGRMHSQVGYRLGYRYGYRQGYFDGDRASWNRRRRELQAAVASVLSTPPSMRADLYPPATPTGTTYLSNARDFDGTHGDEVTKAGDERSGMGERTGLDEHPFFDEDPGQNEGQEVNGRDHSSRFGRRKRMSGRHFRGDRALADARGDT